MSKVRHEFALSSVVCVLFSFISKEGNYLHFESLCRQQALQRYWQKLCHVCVYIYVYSYAGNQIKIHNI